LIVLIDPSVDPNIACSRAWPEAPVAQFHSYFGPMLFRSRRQPGKGPYGRRRCWWRGGECRRSLQCRDSSHRYHRCLGFSSWALGALLRDDIGRWIGKSATSNRATTFHSVDMRCNVSWRRTP